MTQRKLYKGKGDSLAIYALILVLVVLSFIGINSCAKGGFRNRMEEMSDDFVSRQHADEAVARRYPDHRPRNYNTAETVGAWSTSVSPVKAAVSPEVSSIMKEHSLSSQGSTDASK